MAPEKVKTITYAKGGSVEIRTLEPMRMIVIDVVAEGNRTFHADGIMQIDVTKPRQLIKQYREKTGESLSFTSYLLYCLAQAVNENKIVHGLRVGKKVHVFDEVDISTIVERKSPEGYDVPATYVVRRSNYKTYKEINDEIREAQNAKMAGNSLGSSEEAKKTNLFIKMPKFIRNIVFWKTRRDPKFKKDMIGTVNLSSVGMFAKGSTGWPRTSTMWALQLSVGSITESHRHEGDKIIPLELLNATMSLDHDIIDGGPGTRFLYRFKDLLTNGEPIQELINKSQSKS